MVDGGEPGVDSRDEGKHTGRNDQQIVPSSMLPLVSGINSNSASPSSMSREDDVDGQQEGHPACKKTEW